ncbi:Asr1405/Asl0597 family protein [Synechococcus elongatus]|uniref:Asr1405/Asl0597 family protein n=1 Tax=Synechococcus elongatus PCC 11802 TaxID=2283154 RepID=A0AAT9JXL4_SYNEL|nr:Asr1405/Asl0597 family protein [Synechococcus elongatus]QFZ91935.1 hypothetical protein EKO22_05640 [Synechococcus elongatus PCC 11802]
MDSRQPLYWIQLDLDSTTRWDCYHRCCELALDCYCTPCHPLRIQIETPLQAIQVWSICQWIQRDRPSLSNFLESCWQLPVYQEQQR